MRQHMTSIVAIDRNGAIGCNNSLPWSIKSDMAFFRRTTMGKTVIMGRKTYESIGGCLKGRNNLILSRRASLFPSSESCNFFDSIEGVLGTAYEAGAEESFVIGGSSTYLEFASLVDRYVVTFVDHDAADADAFLSYSIREEFSGWASEELGNFPAVPGQDEYAFRIVAYSAPDAEERRAVRDGLAEVNLKWRDINSTRKAKRSHTSLLGPQSAFSI